ncbi:MAG: InlB B-repeat-containing protein [Clostridia bacterium]|nr:InlB B-repeat-containing protein [Clostridia bacterium]
MMISSVFSNACKSFKKYTVTFNLNYIGASQVEPQLVKYGNIIEAPADPNRDGYKFIGWFKEAENADKWDFTKDKVTHDITLYAYWCLASDEPFALNTQHKDFSALLTPEAQESAYKYLINFLPSLNGDIQPYVGDPMPYYENGVFYIYYLKDGGNSYNHSVYLTTTTDFLHFAEVDEPVLEASRSGGQDEWIGTGSVVKVKEKYYFFYTGHTSDESYEYKEKIMLAVGDDPYHFKKVDGFQITPPDKLGQKRDFRDPQAYYDSNKDKIYMTITASKNGVACVLKYTINPELTSIKYNGILFSDSSETFWNLECSDCFKIGDKWYLTYSAQDDTLWYAMSDKRFGKYSEPVRLEGKLFYAAKHISDGKNNYMVGWARRGESLSSMQEISAWGGNLECQQLIQKNDGTLALAPVHTVKNAMNQRQKLLVDGAEISLKSANDYNYKEAFTAYERFMITGKFRFSGDGSFGLAFDYDGNKADYKLISIDPQSNCVRLSFNEGNSDITEIAANLEKNRDYTFTYIQEGSVGTFYIGGIAALTVRVYGVTGKPVSLFAQNNNVVFSDLREYTME